MQLIFHLCVAADFGGEQTIEKIKKENERLKEQLAAESQSTAQQAEATVISLIAGLQETCERYTRKIDVEKRRLEDLEKSAKIMHVKTLEYQEKRNNYIPLAFWSRREVVHCRREPGSCLTLP